MYSFPMFRQDDRPQTFVSTFRCYSVSMLPGNERKDVEKGGKIIMPPSALDQLTRQNIQYPMLFKLTNKRTNTTTHCGVLEFVADEGRIYLPYWMMRNLLLEEGGLVHIENQSLPVATFAKFQPQSTDFLDITNPKAVLENALRNFACLTTGDIVAIKYNEKIYELSVLELKPGNAVSIIECDMNVDFAPPVGYQEPEPQRTSTHALDEDDSVNINEFLDQQFRVFSGQGNRLDGKIKNKDNPNSETKTNIEYKRGVPNYNFKKGKLSFIRNSRQQSGNINNTKENFQAFSGMGQSLKKPKSTTAVK